MENPGKVENSILLSRQNPAVFLLLGIVLTSPIVMRRRDA